MAKGGDERRRLRKTILKYEDNPLDVELSGEQDEEMKLVRAIEEKGKDELAVIVAEFGDDVGDDVIRAWQKDVLSCHELFQDQLKNCMLQTIFYCPSLSYIHTHTHTQTHTFLTHNKLLFTHSLIYTTDRYFIFWK